MPLDVDGCNYITLIPTIHGMCEHIHAEAFQSAFPLVDFGLLGCIS